MLFSICFENKNDFYIDPFCPDDQIYNQYMHDSHGNFKTTYILSPKTYRNIVESFSETVEGTLP